MARAAVPGGLTGSPTGSPRLAWQVARLTAYRDETPTARTLVLSVPDWPGHLAGQHVDLRLTAADGYQARRSYSIANAAAPNAAVPGVVELTVQRAPGGEVSPFLTSVFAVGDPLELRGPVGGWFVWRPRQPEPVLLVAGGSGIVPLMSMIRQRRAAGSTARFRLTYSVRASADRYYVDELADSGLPVSYHYTRSTPAGWPEPPRRIQRSDLTVPGWLPSDAPTCYLCGPTGFVEAAADHLVALGHDPRRIRAERYGPGGG